MPTCSVCGQANPEGFRFCGACGSRLATPSSVEERKVVTVVFCDLVGFTAQSDRADPEDVRDILRPYHLRLRAEIERLGGTLDKFVGDGVMAVFGAPLAHEDDPERAVRCALRMLDAISEMNEARPDGSLAVRIGVTTGEALVALASRDTETVIGDVVNTASRLQGVAPVGGIVVAEATWRATRNAFDYEELGPVQVKGKTGSLPVWRVLGARSRLGVDVEPRTATAFIGRKGELELLEEIYLRALTSPHPLGELVTITGEPGVGKSRLVQELFRFVDTRSELVAWRQGRCLPYGDGITFWALGEIVKAQAGILESDGAEQVAAKLHAAAGAVAEGRAEREWLKARLAPLVGLSAGQAGDADRAELFAAWVRFFHAVAEASPLILVVEDLHWADSALLDFVEHLVERSDDHALLVVTTARSELFTRRPDWGSGAGATTLALPPLPAAEAAQLIAALLGQAVLPAEVQAPLLERAGGNPLYAEELVCLLTERGLLVRDGRGLRLSGGTEELPFPDSVQALIAARLDTLTPEQKSLLQHAAVLGRVFWTGALASMRSTDEQRVEAGLHELAQRELIRAVRSSSVAGQAEYAFRHGLVRDVAYAQIPRTARARRHKAAAEWIEGLAGDRVADHAELLAHHYAQVLALGGGAGSEAERAELAARARHFLLLAGDHLMLLDVPRAGEYFAQALALSGPEEPDHATLQAKLAEVRWETGMSAEAEELFEQAIEGLEAQGDRTAAGMALIRYASVIRNRGRSARSVGATERAVRLLEGEPPGPELAWVYLARAFDELVTGQAEQTRAWAEKALAIATEQGLDRQRAVALELRGSSRSHLGDLAGLDDMRAALAGALDLGLGRETVRVANNLAEEQWPIEGPGPALESVGVGIDVAEQRGLTELAMWLRATALGPHMDLGHWDEVLRLAGDLRAWAQGQGERYLAAWSSFRMAQVLVHQGARARAASLAEEFVPQAREIAEAEVVIPALTVAALVEQAGGHTEAALRLVAEVGGTTLGRARWHRAQELADLVRVCVAAGDLALAEELTASTDLPAQRHRNAALSATALLAEARGNLGEAARLHARAAERWASFGHVFEHAHALLGEGRCLAQLGDDSAAERLRLAREAFATLGARPALEETDGWLERAAAS